MESVTWKTRFYFVAYPRMGKAPGLEKALEERFFLSFKDADEFRKRISSKTGYEYKVFAATAVIPIEEPCEKDLD